MVTTANDRQYVLDLLMDYLGVNRAVATGILANIIYESGCKSDIEEDITDYDEEYIESVGIPYKDTYLVGGYGLFQYTNSRRVDLYNYCEENSLPLEDAESQIQFMCEELKEKFSWFLDEDAQLPDNEETADTVAYDWCLYWECPLDSSQATERAFFARCLYTNGLDYVFI